ncbi:uracil permease [Lactobacillus sp. S2-2]|uniref:uracil-xanthine permease family protein n=1 Tax=Lactobacillus sp. S2-2 TaxID=2692917 RepID=UPI001F012E70|nr:solute carrier family 23 protein [Lactobacillus sp. S2-2]MCF6515190.1 uracil permease [Lactobacillus sp. S2-2]
MDKNSRIDYKPPFIKWLALSLQHLFSMFGSTVIVPILVGLNPSIALFTSGVGTLIHILITKKQIPAYMGSSFAFIVPMLALMKTTGVEGVAQGVISVGLVYLIISILVTFLGTDWIDKILPPIVVGPIVMIIGLSLAGSAANNAMMDKGNYSLVFFFIAILTLFLAILFNIKLKGLLGLIPILLAIIIGYIVSMFFGLVDFSKISSAPWFKLPAFDIIGINYNFNIHWGAIIAMAPIAFVTMTEHMGHLMVLDELTDNNFFKKPGLNRTLAGDGFSSIVSGLFGGPAMTSYGENIGVMAITKVYSVYVIMGAAILAILFSFCNKLNVIIMQMPLPVIGGISFLLFGTIASNGIKIMIDNKIDMNNKKNLMIASVVLVIGIGDLYFKVGNFQFTGVALASIIGIMMNLIIPKNV